MLTAGMANAVLCRFSFSDDWTGLQKMLVFTNGVETRDVMLDGDECYIPHEVLAVPRVRVRVGVYGTDGENVILPTIWANLGDVHDAPDPSGDEATDPSLPIWAKILADIGSLSDLLTKDKESIVRAINEIVQNGGGTNDHTKLLNRDADDQHPIKAITGLQSKLNTIPPASEKITNTEIEEMLK